MVGTAQVRLCPPYDRIPAALPLRARKRDVAFGAEHVAIQVRNPLASARRPVEVAYFSLDMRCHAVPVELRIAIDDVGGRIIAKLAIHADLLELMVERIGLPDVIRIAELPDEIGCANDRGLLAMLLAFDGRKWGSFDRHGNWGGVGG